MYKLNTLLWKPGKGASIIPNVGLSVSPWKKILHQRNVPVDWYFVYKLNTLIWKLGKEASIIPNDGLSVFLSVGRSVEKELHQGNVLWYFLYKLNTLLWKLGKGASIISNVGLIVGPSVGLLVRKKIFYMTEMQLCLETFTARAYSTFALSSILPWKFNLNSAYI